MFSSGSQAEVLSEALDASACRQTLGRQLGVVRELLFTQARSLSLSLPSLRVVRALYVAVLDHRLHSLRCLSLFVSCLLLPYCFSDAPRSRAVCALLPVAACLAQSIPCSQLLTQQLVRVAVSQIKLDLLERLLLKTTTPVAAQQARCTPLPPSSRCGLLPACCLPAPRVACAVCIAGAALQCAAAACDRVALCAAPLCPRLLPQMASLFHALLVPLLRTLWRRRPRSRSSRSRGTCRPRSRHPARRRSKSSATPSLAR